jgi:hypothetical protein
VQTTLSFGDPDALRTEVEELIRVLRKGGNYILGPIGCRASTAIQAGTPPENRVAMFDAALGFCP